MIRRLREGYRGGEYIPRTYSAETRSWKAWSSVVLLDEEKQNPTLHPVSSEGIMKNLSDCTESEGLAEELLMGCEIALIRGTEDKHLSFSEASRWIRRYLEVPSGPEFLKVLQYAPFCQ